MYLEHFQLKSSPFSETVNPDNFFPGAGRADVFRGLFQDIRAGKSFAFLLGGEGCGKTLLCRLLAKQLGGSSITVIYLDDPVGSFDDLLRQICVDLGLTDDLDRDNMVGAFQRELEKRGAEGQRIVLIVDDAEKIFLAALERLLHLLGDLEKFGNFTLILAGRPALAASLEQLSVYCPEADLGHGYELQPLNPAETGRYLTHRLQSAGLKGPENALFVDQAVAKISQEAQGTPRMINSLADEAMRKASREQSQVILPEHVGGKTAGQKNGSPHGKKSQVDGQKKLILISLAAVILGSIGFFLLRDRTGGKMSVPDNSAAVASLPQRSALPAPSSPLPGKTDHAPTRLSRPGAQKETVAQVKPVKAKHRSRSVPQNTAQADKQPQPERTAVQVRPQVVEGIAQANRVGTALFDDRVRASAAWLSGAHAGKYTIQLMMLASPSARKNVEKLFEQKKYSAVLDKLYILQKKTTPPVLFLFYGTYPSMDAARHARNTLPIFLRKHHPYALSIADALTKTED